MTGKHHFSESVLIKAPARSVYEVIADYQKGHVDILPKPPFVSLVVEQGGVGSGTIIQVTMKVLGRKQSFRSVISEPEPGRKLVETNDTGYVTTFVVEPRNEGSSAYVTISTEAKDKKGIVAAIERWMVRRLMQPVFAKELVLLEEVATSWELNGEV